MIIVEEYNNDYKDVVIDFMNKLQDHIISVDPLHMNKRRSGYGEIYTDDFLLRIKNNNGRIFLVFESDYPVGIIGGIIQEQNEIDIVGYIEAKTGIIIEFFVLDNYRGMGIGKKLINSMENYFIEKGCTISYLEVFEPNKSAYNFYKKTNYQERMIGMLKIL